MYGISAFGLSQNLGIEREEAAAYIQRYFERLPRVKAFIEETIEIARAPGIRHHGVRPPAAHPELASANFQERSLGERLAVNSVIQGSAADIIKVAMIRCHERLAAGVPRVAPGAAGARRTGVRGAGGGRLRGPRRHGGGDGGRLSDGPAAQGGRRRRARLAGGQVAVALQVAFPSRLRILPRT